MGNASKVDKAAHVSRPMSANVHAGGGIPEIRHSVNRSKRFPEGVARSGDALRMLYCPPNGLRLAAGLHPVI
ncbi:hypothetical protein FIBSPDRAFT_871675 [Athelia psychrophila]|uniref:Uncharacterized protein n=1 Tax=Athelia psychrophila TaxID=1759441 RepID=A0A166A9U2_9AGAM|nr:hypothetical protein FIBSPDRAFT_871675 [Fibularhizoctonia sp. CBS 109695]